MEGMVNGFDNMITVIKLIKIYPCQIYPNKI